MVSVHRVRAQLEDLKDTVREQLRLVLLDLDPSPQERASLEHLLITVKHALESLPKDRTKEMRAEFEEVLLNLEELDLQKEDFQLVFPQPVKTSTAEANPTEAKNKVVRFGDNPAVLQANSGSFNEPYRDDLDMSNQQIYDTNGELILDQDRRLDQLSQSVRRQNAMGVEINDELTTQNSMLDDLEAQTDNSAARLRRATDNAEHFNRKSRERGYCMTISILVLVLFILLVVL